MVKQEISAGDKQKLSGVFSNMESQIAHLMRIPGGIDTLTNSITTLSHGCAHNMGTQLSLAVTSTLLVDRSKAEQLLYTALNQIITEILSNPIHGDLIESNSNPLQNAKIGSFFASSDALHEFISKEIEQAGSPWNIREGDQKSLMRELVRELGEDEFSIFYEKCEEKLTAAKLDEYSAKLAAYLIIKQTLGETAQKITGAADYEKFITQAEESEIVAAPSTSPAMTKQEFEITLADLAVLLKKEAGLKGVRTKASSLPGKSIEGIIAPFFAEGDNPAKSKARKLTEQEDKGSVVVNEEKLGQLKEALIETLGIKDQEMLGRIDQLNFETLARAAESNPKSFSKTMNNPQGMF